MFRQVLIFALLALTQVQADNKKCPSITGKLPFDETKFAGLWYRIAMYNPDIPKALLGDRRCIRFNISMMRTDTKVTMKLDGSGKLNGKLRTFEGMSESVKLDKPSTMCGVWKRDDETKFSEVHKQSIIATDYDTYAIFMSCGKYFVDANQTFARKLHMNIWSRQPTLSEETLKVLMNVLSSYEVDLNEVQMIDQTNC